MTKPTFDDLLAGAKELNKQGKGAVNCTYTLAAQGKAYPRTCQRCGLGPCAFQNYLMAAKQTHDSRWDAKEIATKLTEHQKNAIYWLDREWQMHGFDEQRARLWWHREAVLLRPAIIEHRTVHYDDLPPEHQFRLTEFGAKVREEVDYGQGY